MSECTAASTSAGPGPRILYLDAHDSFANNIVDLLAASLPSATITVITIDDPRFPTRRAFRCFLRSFDGVVAGPGPGTPEEAADVGLMAWLWGEKAPPTSTSDSRPPNTSNDDNDDYDDDGSYAPPPVLGICLGFQSMCLAHGARIQRLRTPRHGLVSEVLHRSRAPLQHAAGLRATQYHSLHVDLAHPIQAARARVARPRDLWAPSAACPALEPLAWDVECAENGAVLMAARVSGRPFWGVQFHPESVCSNDGARSVVRGWWEEAVAWNAAHERVRSAGGILGRPDDDGGEDAVMGEAPPERKDGDEAEEVPPRDLARLLSSGLQERLPGTVEVATCGSGRITTQHVCCLFGVPESEAVVLESGLRPDLAPAAPETGRHSIIGLFVPGETARLHYRVKTRALQVRDGEGRVRGEVAVRDVWAYLREVMKELRPSVGPPPGKSAPFWGGLMGYVTHEAGLETIGVEAPAVPPASRNDNDDGDDEDDDGEDGPDVCFALVSRSIVIDHALKKVFVQSLRADDRIWLANASARIQAAVQSETALSWAPRLLPPFSNSAGSDSDSADSDRTDLSATPSSSSSSSSPATDPATDPATAHHNTALLLAHHLSRATLQTPSAATYTAQVAACLEHIRAGDSYELCLTGETRVRVPRAPPGAALPWLLYARLARLNPAPFGAYLRFDGIPSSPSGGDAVGGVTVLSSSPERLVRVDRAGAAQCRPIKGTLRKAPGVDRAAAERALAGNPKERAENLMIADLTRHQLHAAYGPGRVTAPRMMAVEELASVWQLVSVLEGRPAEVPLPRDGEGDDATGAEWVEPAAGSGSSSAAGSRRSGSPAEGTAAAGEGAEQSAPLPSVSSVDVLRACLPPGSMTGAPKKRSCEILGRIEFPGAPTASAVTTTTTAAAAATTTTTAEEPDEAHRRKKRGIYSGALGYLCVSGAADFSVVIRTAVRHTPPPSTRGDPCALGTDTWRIAAGGAVTAQSDPAAEFAEMRAKLESVLRAFAAPRAPALPGPDGTGSSGGEAARGQEAQGRGRTGDAGGTQARPGAAGAAATEARGGRGGGGGGGGGAQDKRSGIAVAVAEVEVDADADADADAEEGGVSERGPVAVDAATTTQRPEPGQVDGGGSGGAVEDGVDGGHRVLLELRSFVGALAGGVMGQLPEGMGPVVF